MLNISSIPVKVRSGMRKITYPSTISPFGRHYYGNLATRPYLVAKLNIALLLLPSIGMELLHAPG
ncbi:MAG: hypothetical protein NVSMB33_11300 [Ktedonobacteraceae bacterium]